MAVQVQHRFSTSVLDNPATFLQFCSYKGRDLFVGKSCIAVYIKFIISHFRHFSTRRISLFGRLWRSHRVLDSDWLDTGCSCFAHPPDNEAREHTQEPARPAPWQWNIFSTLEASFHVIKSANHYVMYFIVPPQSFACRVLNMARPVIRSLYSEVHHPTGIHRTKHTVSSPVQPPQISSLVSPPQIQCPIRT